MEESEEKKEKGGERGKVWIVASIVYILLINDNVISLPSVPHFARFLTALRPLNHF